MAGLLEKSVFELVGQRAFQSVVLSAVPWATLLAVSKVVMRAAPMVEMWVNLRAAHLVLWVYA